MRHDITYILRRDGETLSTHNTVCLGYFTENATAQAMAGAKRRPMFRYATDVLIHVYPQSGQVSTTLWSLARTPDPLPPKVFV